MTIHQQQSAAIESLEQRRLLALPAFGFALTFGSSDAADFGNTVATDGAGNVYVAGQFEDVMDVQPGAGVRRLTSKGDYDVWLAKYSPAGALLWAHSFGSRRDDAPTRLALDNSGNVYLTGTYSSTCDFDPGSATYNLSSRGNLDIFLAKYTSGGKFLWARSMGGGFEDTSAGLAVAGNGDIYVGGRYVLQADLDGGSGVRLFHAEGSSESFIEKMDSSGRLQWVRQWGANPDRRGFIDLADIASGPGGSVYATGQFSDWIDFDPTSRQRFMDSDGDNAFVLRLDRNGALVFAGALGRGTDTTGVRVAVDGQGNAYTTGQFTDSGDFNPGSGTAMLDSISDNPGDVYVAKLTATGRYAWAKHFGGDNAQLMATSLALDSQGRPYLTGGFVDTVDFDPGPGVTELTADGNEDGNFLTNVESGTNGYIVALDRGGAFRYVARLGGENAVLLPQDIALDPSGNIITTGSFYGTADFQPGSGAVSRTASDDNAVFLSKLLA